MKTTKVCSVGYVPKYAGGICFGNFLTEVFGKVRYGLNTGTRQICKFGTLNKNTLGTGIP